MGAVPRPGRVLKGSLFLKYLCVRRRKRKYCTVFDIAGGLEIYTSWWYYGGYVGVRRLPSVESIFLIYPLQLFLETVLFLSLPPSFFVSRPFSLSLFLSPFFAARSFHASKCWTTNVNIGAFSRGHHHSIWYFARINDIYIIVMNL